MNIKQHFGLSTTKYVKDWIVTIFNRPDLAWAVLQTSLSLTPLLINLSPTYLKPIAKPKYTLYIYARHLQPCNIAHLGSWVYSNEKYHWLVQKLWQFKARGGQRIEVGKKRLCYNGLLCQVCDESALKQALAQSVYCGMWGVQCGTFQCAVCSVKSGSCKYTC